MVVSCLALATSPVPTAAHRNNNVFPIPSSSRNNKKTTPNIFLTPKTTTASPVKMVSSTSWKPFPKGDAAVFPVLGKDESDGGLLVFPLIFIFGKGGEDGGGGQEMDDMMMPFFEIFRKNQEESRSDDMLKPFFFWIFGKQHQQGDDYNNNDYDGATAAGDAVVSPYIQQVFGKGSD